MGFGLKHISAATAIFLGASISGTLGQSTTAVVPITVTVQPIAQIQFPAGAGLHLTVPPATSTLPDNGVGFIVTGNASATITAAPDAYLFVNPYVVGATTQAGRYLGKATHASGALIGYNLSVEFPVFNFHFLPGANGGSTDPATANVGAGPVQGFLHLLASHKWTPDATMPDVGDYHGTIIVTMTASL